jgi:hypothetical protein
VDAHLVRILLQLKGQRAPLLLLGLEPGGDEPLGQVDWRIVTIVPPLQAIAAGDGGIQLLADQVIGFLQ